MTWLTRRNAIALALAPLLTKRAGAATQTVGIVGAGVAGLSSARLLADAGFSVTVFEAKDRIGGRVHSIRRDGVTLELGANWIHGDDGNPLVPLARKAGMASIATGFDDWAILDGAGGVLHAPDDELVDELYAWLEARAEEGDGDTLAEAIGDGPRKLRGNRRARSVWDALLNREIAADYGAEARDLSPDLFDLSDGFDGADLLVTNGYGRIPDMLAKGLDIRLGRKVTSIRHDRDGVRLEGSWGSADFGHAIVTLPLGVLKAGSVTFDPPLSRPKAAAIGRTGVATLEKAFLFPDRPFRFPAPHVTVMHDAPWQHMFDLSGIAGRPAVVAYCGGDAARRSSDADDARNRDWMLQAVRIAVDDPDIDATGFLRTNWLEDPAARGSYTFPGPDSRDDDVERLAASEGERLHFAGEATSPYWGTVHGALLSGRAAARRVSEAL